MTIFNGAPYAIAAVAILLIAIAIAKSRNTRKER